MSNPQDDYLTAVSEQCVLPIRDEFGLYFVYSSPPGPGTSVIPARLSPKKSIRSDLEPDTKTYMRMQQALRISKNRIT